MDKKEAALLQFPSAVGEEKVEIAERTADTDKDEATRFTKVFVVKTNSDLPADDEMHDRNKLAVLQEALQRGIYPDGEARLDSVKDHEDGVSKYVTYSVAVTPAHVLEDAADEAETPSKVKAARRARKD